MDIQKLIDNAPYGSSYYRAETGRYYKKENGKYWFFSPEEVRWERTTLTKITIDDLLTTGDIVPLYNIHKTDTSNCTEVTMKSLPEIVNTAKVKSDGESSSYYWCELPLSSVKVDSEKGTVGFMVEEFNEHCLNNDFDASTITKCLKRMGCKEGNTEEYDAKKIAYSANRILNKHKQV